MGAVVDVARGLKWTAGTKFAGQVLTWTITIILMRELSPSDYGLLASASVVISFLAIFSEIGLGSALVQQIEESRQQLRQAFGFIILLNVFLFAALFMTAPLVARLFQSEALVDIIKVMAIQFLVVPFISMPEVLLQRRLDFKRRAICDVTSLMFGSLIALCLAFLGYGVWSLVAGSLLGYICRAILLNFAAPFFAMPSLSVVGMKRILVFGGNVTGARLLWNAFTQSDALIVGRLLGVDVLGIYSVAIHLATLPVQRVGFVLNQVVFPAVSKFQKQRELIALKLLSAMSMLSVIMLPILWGLSAVSDELIPLLIGEKWRDAILPLKMIALVMAFRAIAGILPAVTDAMGHSNITFRNALVSCAVMPLAFYAGAAYGIKGIAFAWVLVYPFLLLFGSFQMLRIFNLGLFDVLRVIAPAVICAALMYTSIVFCQFYLLTGTDAFSALLVEIFVGAFVYVTSSYFFNKRALLEVIRFARASL